MKNKSIVFTRNFPYNLGGAENSLLEDLLVKKENISSVHYANQNNTNFIQGIENLSCDMFSHDQLKIFNRFFYYEYVFNKKSIINIISNLDFDRVITQNRWAPAIVNAASDMGKETIYYLRDETSLGDINNYYYGLKKIYKKMYNFSEYPALLKFNEDNEIALNQASKVISNSNFMAERLWEKYRVHSEVIYPKINFERLKENYDLAISINRFTNDGIVLIGDTIIKGVDCFLKLAALYPNQKFYIFGKNNDFSSSLENVYHLGWSNDPAYPFSRAKVVVVPSVWNEAFGRVAVEARFLNIPVLVSNRGGLPEAVNYKTEYIVNDFQDLQMKVKRYI